MKNMKKLLLFVLSAALAAPLFAQRRVQRDTVRIGGKSVGVTVTNWYCIEGDELPAFTVRDQNGKTIRSADLRGKTVVVSFWIGSCAPGADCGRSRSASADVGPGVRSLRDVR